MNLYKIIKFSKLGLIAFILGGSFPEAVASSSENDTAARGSTPEMQKGYDIAARADRSDVGFSDSIVSVTMILNDSSGKQKIRKFAFQTLEKIDESVGDKSLVIFERPRDVKGTALLTHTKILNADDQWLFLPSLKRVKRISSNNKSGAFVGSEFAFEDFSISELNKFTYKFLRHEEIDGKRMDVVKRYPRYENSGYSYQVTWIDQEIFQTRKIEFFDRKGALLKTLLLSDYREYDGIWRAHTLKMINRQTGNSTELIYEGFGFKTGLTQKDFERNILTRIR